MRAVKAAVSMVRPRGDFLSGGRPNSLRSAWIVTAVPVWSAGGGLGESGAEIKLSQRGGIDTAGQTGGDVGQMQGNVFNSASHSSG